MNTTNCEQKKEYNLPIFINTPLFVLLDKNLDFLDKYLFSFLWSLAVAGRKITVSDDYLAHMFNISERYVREKIKYLESISYIRRIRKGRRFIEVLRFENTHIEYNELNNSTIGTTVPNSTEIEPIGTTVPVQPEPQFLLNRNYSSAYNKEDIKENIKDTTTSNSSNFFDEYKEKEQDVLNCVVDAFDKQNKERCFREEALSDPRCIDTFNQRFQNLPVTIEQLYDDCVDYWSQKNQMVYKSRFLTHLKKAPLENYKELKDIKHKSSITPDERNLIQSYCSMCNSKRTPDATLQNQINILKIRLQATDTAIAREALASMEKSEELMSTGNFEKLAKSAIVKEQQRRPLPTKTTNHWAVIKGILK